MNLDNLKLSGVGEIHLTDSLNASLLKLNVKLNSSSVAPNSNDLFIYVDKADMNNQTDERKQYLFDLSSPLKQLNGVSDEFKLTIEFEENEAILKATVKRMIGVSEGTDYVLDSPVIEEIESFPITLFEGENYIYTNYTGAVIDLMYPKDTEINRMFLNNAIYYGHKLKKDGEFTLDDIYFKDAFTKTEEQLNLEVDNANIKCLTSKQNKFSLDSEGNLIVNSITTNDPNNISFNSIYPVGSIYMSVSSVSPSTLFGGTWEQLKDRFLLGAGDIYENGATGGSAELQAHSHGIPSLSGTAQSNGDHSHVTSRRTSTYGSGMQSNWRCITAPASANGDYNQISNTENAGAHTHTVTTNASTTESTGNGTAGNMPPYLTVYMWKRVS